MLKRRTAMALILVSGLAGVLHAQEGTTSPTSSVDAGETSFEVASIRLTTSTERDHTHIWSSPGDGHFRAQNVSINDLLEFAFALPDSRFVAAGQAKTLLRSPRFDLEAKSSPAMDERLHGLPSQPAKQEKRGLVQSLLAERFQLKTHTETRELPIYTLVVARQGPKFTASVATGTSYSMGRGSLSLEGGDSTVSIMADNLASVLGRPVIDDTGIKGRYLMKLRWLPDDVTGNPATDPSLPSIFTAVEEQLGLRLVSGKGPVSVLVIDHVEMPSAN